MPNNDQASDGYEAIFERARAVLDANDRGTYTVPSKNLYPHQWLWDSCFIAIGLRHYDVDRAQSELLSLLRGQWTNGMLPSSIFGDDPGGSADKEYWQSYVSPYSPDDIATTGITQPPMLAESVYRIGEKLKLAERRSWYKKIYPSLLHYHQWLYNDRDPHQEGLVLQIHPWETGMDNSPPWMHELHEHLLPWWIRALKVTKLDYLTYLVRRDKNIPLDQRLAITEALSLFAAQRRLRRKSYNIDRILDHSLFAIEDLTFNCILIRGNERLKQIAKTIREDIPEELLASMDKTARQLEHLWDPYAEQYFSRDFVSHRLLKEPSFATLMPLYAGTISPERAGLLVRMIENTHLFGLSYPLPTVPANSNWFKPKSYWQGPTWFNVNWMIIDGLLRYGFKEHAEAIAASTLELIEHTSFYEYYDPTNGEPAGVENFSWTAALTIDLMNQKF